jgi:cellulose synthase (UDP-forming)/cellulose synthase operon protein B
MIDTVQVDVAQPVPSQPGQHASSAPELEFESVPRLGPGRIILRILMVLALFAVLCLVATIPLEWKDQALFGCGLLIFATILSKRSKAHSVTLFLAFLSMFSTVRYAYWRFSATYNYLAFNWAEARTLDLIFVFILLGAESYAFLILFLGFFQTARPLNRRPIPLPEDPDLWPSVDLYRLATREIARLCARRWQAR